MKEEVQTNTGENIPLGLKLMMAGSVVFTGDMLIFVPITLFVSEPLLGRLEAIAIAFGLLGLWLTTIGVLLLSKKKKR